jgi:hypothetical protein
MRFVAPARADVGVERFAHPIFDDYRPHLDLLTGTDWPALDELNRRMAAVDDRIRFVEQDAALLAEGQHYELRIARDNRVATRASNWHDLLNALIWIEHPAIKRGLNARQVADIERVGTRERTRGQYALTHFDEAGVIVHLRDAAMIEAWDSHDWAAVFVDHADSWRHGHVTVFGHALLEHALVPDRWFVGKALVIVSENLREIDIERIAEAIVLGEILLDPLELRPLPLSGIPGWHPATGRDFYTTAPCFQAIRGDRIYPDPLRANSL